MKKEILLQMDTAWRLFQYHCDGLGEEEAAWCKTYSGLQVRRADGKWTADWPETESYSIGPPSIAWILWHMMFWWTAVLSASRDNKMTGRENVVWPGSARAAIQEIERCHEEWASFIDSMDEADLRSDERCRWPFKEQSLCSLALWLNVELMKNAAEIGAARFLYAVISE